MNIWLSYIDMEQSSSARSVSLSFLVGEYSYFYLLIFSYFLTLQASMKFQSTLRRSFLSSSYLRLGYVPSQLVWRYWPTSFQNQWVLLLKWYVVITVPITLVEPFLRYLCVTVYFKLFGILISILNTWFIVFFLLGLCPVIGLKSILWGGEAKVDCWTKTADLKPHPHSNL